MICLVLVNEKQEQRETSTMGRRQDYHALEWALFSGHREVVETLNPECDA